MESSDPAGRILAATSYTSVEQRIDTLRELYSDSESEAHESVGVIMSLTRAYLESGDLAAAEALLEENAHRLRSEWRLVWYVGVIALLKGDPVGAYPKFQQVLSAMPGENGPKLALAATAELILDVCPEGDRTRWARSSEHFYRTVWSVDRARVRSTVSAPVLSPNSVNGTPRINGEGEGSLPGSWIQASAVVSTVSRIWNARCSPADRLVTRRAASRRWDSSVSSSGRPWHRRRIAVRLASEE